MHSLPTRLLALVALAFLVQPHPARACTAFQLKSGDGAQIYFRSMEFGYPFNSKMLIVPRGTEYTGTAPGGKPGKKWTVQYGYVGLNVDVLPTAVADGQNEKGLAVGMLYLPGYSQYLDPAAATKLTINLVKVDVVECTPAEERQDIYVCSILIETGLGPGEVEFKRVEAALVKAKDAWRIQ